MSWFYCNIIQRSVNLKRNFSWNYIAPNRNEIFSRSQKVVWYLLVFWGAMEFQEYLLLTFPDLQLNCRIYMILMLLFFWQWQNNGFVLCICRNYLLHWFYKKISKIFDQNHKLRTIHKRQSTLPPHPCRQFFTHIHRQFFTTFFTTPSEYCRLFMPLIDFSV